MSLSSSVGVVVKIAIVVVNVHVILDVLMGAFVVDVAVDYVRVHAVVVCWCCCCPCCCCRY